MSFESDLPYGELVARSVTFPEKPTEENPKRHTVSLGILNVDDLWEIYQTVESKLVELGEIDIS